MGNDTIEKYLVETNAYEDLDDPVVLTSGQLGIFYINTQKLLEDGGQWKEACKNGSLAAINHAIQMSHESDIFKDTINTIVAKMPSILPSNPRKRIAISGGERRDWLFSGPIARIMDVPHISLYKDNERVEMIHPSGNITTIANLDHTLDEYHVIHISDLLTEGSSAFTPASGDGLDTGWIPMLRNRGATIEKLLTVVTRKQGGEERLKSQGVDVDSFVSIDEDFLETYSNNPERALEYMKDATKWSENYLRENGATSLVNSFAVDGSIQLRAIKFLKRYEEVLRDADKWEELGRAFRTAHGFDLNSTLDCS